MSDDLPSVTIIIAARPDQTEINAADASCRLDYPKEKFEIVIARGKHPSVQRNTALRAAKGDIIYFLDDDSVPLASNLRHAVKHFSDPAVQIVGGPNICPSEAPRIEQAFALTMGSWLAFGPSRARYRPIGRLRHSSEKELILCNLLARRQALLDLDGFDESLYPNEENALMDDLQKRGRILLYDPELIVYRRPRSTLKAFTKMLATYGRGRAEQFRLHPTIGSALNFIPPLFCLYLLCWLWLPDAARSLLFLYLFILFVQGLVLVGLKGISRLPGLICLMLITHICYGFGFWRGLFAPLKHDRQRIPIEVKLEYRAS